MASVTTVAGVIPPCEGDSGAIPAAHEPRQVPGRSHRVVSSLIGGRDGVRPAGVALGRVPGTDRFTITVLDEAGRSILPLGAFLDDEVVALWRGLAASSGLPLMIEGADGSREEAYPQIGRIQLGSSRIRRRHGLLNGRRPRFLLRRKTGRLPLRPQVFRGSDMFTEL